MKKYSTTEKQEAGFGVITYKVTETDGIFANELNDAGVAIHFDDHKAYVLVDGVPQGVEAKSKEHAVAFVNAMLGR